MPTMNQTVARSVQAKQDVTRLMKHKSTILAAAPDPLQELTNDQIVAVLKSIGAVPALRDRLVEAIRDSDGTRGTPAARAQVILDQTLVTDLLANLAANPATLPVHALINRTAGGHDMQCPNQFVLLVNAIMNEFGGAAGQQNNQVGFFDQIVNNPVIARAVPARRNAILQATHTLTALTRIRVVMAFIGRNNPAGGVFNRATANIYLGLPAGAPNAMAAVTQADIDTYMAARAMGGAGVAVQNAVGDLNVPYLFLMVGSILDYEEIQTTFGLADGVAFAPADAAALTMVEEWIDEAKSALGTVVAISQTGVRKVGGKVGKGVMRGAIAPDRVVKFCPDLIANPGQKADPNCRIFTPTTERLMRINSALMPTLDMHRILACSQDAALPMLMNRTFAWMDQVRLSAAANNDEAIWLNCCGDALMVLYKIFNGRRMIFQVNGTMIQPGRITAGGAWVF